MQRMSQSELTSMTVSLPASQKEYVKAQAEASGCSTPSEFIRRLIHQDQRTRAQEELDRLILEGLESPSEVMTPERWEEFRQSVRDGLARRRGR